MKKLIFLFLFVLLGCSTTQLEYNGQNTVYFDTNSSNLTQIAKTTLNNEIAFYKQTNDNLVIIGYTDKIGNPAYNLQLGYDRAYMVKKYLILNGISENRITIYSYGEFEKPFEINQYSRCVQIAIEDYE